MGYGELMDADLRARFDKSDEKQDSILVTLNDHLTVSAVRNAETKRDALAANERIAKHEAECKEKSNRLYVMWSGIVLAVVSALIALVIAYIQKGAK
jgi:hypothetical protein